MAGDQGSELQEIHTATRQKGGLDKFGVATDGVGRSGQVDDLFAAGSGRGRRRLRGGQYGRGKPVEVAASSLPRDGHQHKAEQRNQDRRKPAGVDKAGLPGADVGTAWGRAHATADLRNPDSSTPYHPRTWLAGMRLASKPEH